MILFKIIIFIYIFFPFFENFESIFCKLNIDKYNSKYYIKIVEYFDISYSIILKKP